MRHYDVIVVGCGAMGSSISYSMAKRGLKVLTLDRFGLNHEFGSSHGKTRIIRLAYFEDPRYVPLLRRAFELWDELARKSGARIIRRTGGLMIGREGGPLVAGVLRSAREHALPHRILKAQEVQSAFPAFRLEETYQAVHEESSGILFPEECTAAYVGLARESGGAFGFLEKVVSWRRTGEGIEVETSKGRYGAEKVVFSAGPWTGQLLPNVVPLTCERQVMSWFEPVGGEAFSAERMPVFIMEEDGVRYFYGVPDVGHGVKVARSHGGMTVDPDRIERKVNDGDLAPVKDFVQRRFPGLKSSPLASTTCIYSNTPDGNFVIDFHPEDRGVLVVSACSGHGFKFSSVVGEIAADLMLDGRTGLDISFLNVGRFRTG